MRKEKELKGGKCQGRMRGEKGEKRGKPKLDKWKWKRRRKRRTRRQREKCVLDTRREVIEGEEKKKELRKRK